MVPDAGPQRAHAIAKVTVESSKTRPLDDTRSPLSEITITERFSGDIEGRSFVRALETERDERSASLVSLQRVEGRLGVREGAFLLRGAERVENGRIKATWSVVPGSGTGELSGLRGEGGFRGEFGKSSIATLTYWFE